MRMQQMDTKLLSIHKNKKKSLVIVMHQRFYMMYLFLFSHRFQEF